MISKLLKITLKNYKKKLFGLLFLVSALNLSGQNQYQLFNTYETYRPDSTGTLYFAIDNLNFFKNNENKLERSADYTLTGAFLRPTVVYYPDSKLRMQLGGHVLKFNGRDDYAHLSPWFNVHYQPTHRIAVILGNLDADQGHLMAEHLYNPELFYSAKPEVGLQTKYTSDRLTTDLWIDWQQLIMAGDPYKERFAFGVRSNLFVSNLNGGSLFFPFTFYGRHEGGTIGTAPGLAKSFITLTPGLVYKKPITGSLITDLELTALFSLSTYPKDNLIFKQSSGWGLSVSGNVNTPFGGITTSFWHGHLFYTPQGSPIFQNYPGKGSVWLADHELIDLKYHYQRQIIPNTSFGFMFDYYYDTLRRKAVNSAGLYLIVNLGIHPSAKR